MKKTIKIKLPGAYRGPIRIFGVRAKVTLDDQASNDGRVAKLVHTSTEQCYYVGDLDPGDPAIVALEASIYLTGWNGSGCTAR